MMRQIKAEINTVVFNPITSVTPIALNAAGSRLISEPLLTICAIPKIIYPLPKVVMKAGTFTTCTRTPFTSPTNNPTPSVSMIDIHIGSDVFFTRRPIVIEHNPNVYPRDKSIPPVISTSVMPKHAIIGIAACLIINEKLLIEKKLLTNMDAIIAKIKKITTLPFDFTNLRDFSDISSKVLFSLCIFTISHVFLPFYFVSLKDFALFYRAPFLIDIHSNDDNNDNPNKNILIKWVNP